jgi:hypothetical protein
MRTTTLSLLFLALFADGTFAADDKPSAQAKQPRLSGLSAMLDAVGKMPDLSGLIKPEKMGLLTENECEVEDNEVHLLSDNEGDALSNNTIKVVSPLRILSGITVNVQINIPGKTAKAKKANHKSRKKNKTGRKPKRR